MRYCSLIIIFLLLGIQSNAQSSLKDTFSFHDADFDVQMESAFPKKQTGGNSALYIFINEAGNSSTADLDKGFDGLSIKSPQVFPKIKLSISLSKDSSSAAFFERISSKIASLIILQCSTHNFNINGKNVVLCGANDGAVAALYLAAMLPDTFNKTGIFLKDYASFPLLKEQLGAVSSRISGKVFIHTEDEQKENYATEFVDALALNPGIMIYKIDELKESSINIFFEFYEWSMADGNNYIINTNQ